MTDWHKQRSELEKQEEVALKRIDQLIQQQEQVVMDYRQSFDALLDQFNAMHETHDEEGQTAWQRGYQQVVEGFGINTRQMMQQIVDTRFAKNEIRNNYQRRYDELGENSH